MGLKSWLEDWWARIDRKIYENRPRRLREREVPVDTVVIHITADEFRSLGRGARLKPEIIERYIKDSFDRCLAFEFHGSWLRVDKL